MTPGKDASEVNTAVAAAIALIDQLLEVLEEENRALGRGFPASLMGSTERKNELADAFERWVADVRSNRIDLTVADDALRAEMLARSQSLHVTVDENVSRLRAAIDASHRRLDAVMRAIREDMAENSPYGADGRVRTGRAPNASARSPLSV